MTIDQLINELTHIKKQHGGSVAVKFKNTGEYYGCSDIVHVDLDDGVVVLRTERDFSVGS